MKTVKKLALIVGHRESSQGAVGSLGISEFVFNTELAKHIIKTLPCKSVETKIFYRNDKRGYRNNMIELHRRIDLWGADVDLSLHFNASSSTKKVSGHEVLYNSSNGLHFARKLNNSFAKYLKTRDRGVKQRLSGAGSFGLRVGASYSILAEPFFARQQGHYSVGKSKRLELVTAYRKFIIDINNK